MSIGAAEALAAGEGVDGGKSIADHHKALLNVNVDLFIVVHSRALCTALSTKRLSANQSIRGDIGVIRHEFQMEICRNLYHSQALLK